MSKEFLKPKKGLKVFHPTKKRFLKESGEEVEITTYWMRRKKEGDFEDLSVKPAKAKVEPVKIKDKKKKINKDGEV